MAHVLHKTADPVDYRVSVNTPDFPPADWFINPDVSAVVAVPTKYWARPLSDPVTEMSQSEKDAVDAAEAAAITTAARNGAKEPVAVSGEPDGVRLRGLIELCNKRDNYLVNRIVELQQALDAIKATTGNNVGSVRDAIPASWLATSTRTRADAVADFRAGIDAGTVDAGE
jgi:hypothetical protein